MAQRPSKPPGVYARHQTLWITYTGADGRRRRHPTRFHPGEEEQAAKLRATVLGKLRTGDATAADAGPPTVTVFAAQWLEARKTQVTRWADDDRWLRRFLPKIGRLPITEVKRRHIAELIAAARRSGEHAPKSVYNGYSVLQAMFKAAVRAELIEVSPCTLDKQELGPKVDADSEWRATAIFSRAELETLISDERVPPYRRLFYALLGIAGLRLGEAAGLRWRHYHPELEPLGRLLIATSYNKGRTKTQQTREMPVHPTLAAMLAEWKLRGWAELMGRAPEADDLIAPVAASLKLPLGSMWTPERAYGRRKIDLEALGLRHRRAHDLRRTFISLSLEDGARRDLLKRCTHGVPRADAFDCYVTIGWPALCAEVAKLRVQRRAADANVLRLAMNASADPPAEKPSRTVTGPVTGQRKRPAFPLAFRMTPSGLEQSPAFAGDLCSAGFPPPSPEVDPASAEVPIAVHEGPFRPTCARCVTGHELLAAALAAERAGDRERLRALLDACLAVFSAHAQGCADEPPSPAVVITPAKRTATGGVSLRIGLADDDDGEPTR